jgi:transcription-repair coupling factor (superfamily II helicase)
MKNKRPTSNKFESELSTWSLKKGNKLIITSNSSLAESTYRDLKEQMDEVVLLPHTETLPYDFFSPSKNIRNHRMQTLSKLLSDEKHTLITSIQALMSPCPDKTHLLPFELLETDQLINRKNFIYGLKNSGYERKDIVTEIGEYSLRGSIIDIYPTGSELPIRIEINNKKIESLRTFSPVSQVTIKRINSFFALPPQEYSLSKKGINSFKINWRKAFDVFEEDSDIFKSISKGKAEEGTEIYLPLFFNEKITAISFLENFDQVLLDQNVKKELKEYQSLIDERFEEYRYDIKRPLLEPRDIFLTNKEYEIFLSGCEVQQIKFQESKIEVLEHENERFEKKRYN